MSKWVIPPADPSDVYLKRVRHLESEASKRVKNQHVVSRVVLKGFAVPGSRLTPFDLHLGREQRPRGLGGCGRVPDFLTFASESAEQLWNTVEDKLHDAICAAREGTLHNHSSHVESITDCITLHLVRSIRYLELHKAIIEKSTEDVCQSVLHTRKAMLESEFRRRYGLEAAGPEALAILLEGPIAQWQDLDRRGALVRTSMEVMFRRIREALRVQAVEVWHVPPGHELLISDSPAVTFRYLAENIGVESNVAIGDAHCIVLPLARDCLVAIGPNARDSELSPDQVGFFNKLQIAVAYRYVYYHPTSRLRDFVQAMLGVHVGSPAYF
jgi:hypothetical protein